MSTTVDSKVVEMKFDNRQFEKNVSQTIKSCEKLKKASSFEKSGKGLEGLAKASKKISFDKAARSAETLGVKLESVSFKSKALERAYDKIIDKIGQVAEKGKQLVKTFTVDAMADGMEEYNLKMNSIMTIMNSSGKSMKTVSKYLNDLNTYADQTKYSFSDMTASIGKFTNAGVGLKDSVEAIKGVANLAAYSGSSSAQANSAMYNFSQSLSSGFLNLLDYKSIELAGMATKRFRQELIDTALAEKTLVKVGKDQYKTLTTNNKNNVSDIFGVNQIRDTLRYKWVNNDVLIKTLQKFTDTTTELGQAASAAATEYKTFEEMFDSMKEEAGSGWAQTWEIIFGNFEQAKKLWTGVGRFIGGIIGESAKNRNDLLKGWDKLGGRIDLLMGLANAFEILQRVLMPVKTAFRDIFPATTAKNLADLTLNFRALTMCMIPSYGTMSKIERAAKGVFAVVKILTTVLGGGLKFAITVVNRVLGVMGTSVLDLAANLGDVLVEFQEWLLQNSFIADAVSKTADILATAIANTIVFLNGFARLPMVQKFVAGFGDTVKTVFGMTVEYFQNGGKVIGEFVERVKALDHIDLGTIIDLILDFKNTVLKYFLGIGDIFNPFKRSFLDLAVYLIKGRKNVADFGDGVISTFAQVQSAIWTSVVEKHVKNMVNFLTSLAEVAKTVASTLREKGVISAIQEFFLSIVSGVQSVSSKLKIGDTNIAALIGEILGIVALFKMAKSLEKVASQFGSIVSAFAGIGTSIKGVFGSISGVLNAYAKDLKSEALLKTAGAIAVLAGSVFLLAQLDAPRLWSSVGALAALAGVMILLSAATSRASNWSSGAGMAGIGIGILSLVSSLKILDSLKPDRLRTNILALIKLMAVFGLLSAAVTKAGKEMKSSALYFVSIGGSMNLMARALKKIDAIQNPQKALWTISSLMLGMRGLAKASKLGHGQSSMEGFGKDVLLMSASLIVLATAMKKIAKLDMESISKNSKAFVLVFGSLAGMMVMCRIVATGKDEVIKAGSTILAMSASLILIATAMKLIAKIDENGLKRASAVTAGVLLLFGGLVAVSHFSGANATKAGVMILAMSGALLLLTGAIAILSRINTKDLVKATASIAILEGLFALIVYVSGKAGNAEKTVKMLTISIGILAASLVTLSFIDEDAVRNATGCLTVAMLSLAGMIAAAGQLKTGGTANLALIAVLVGEIAGILSLLAGLNIETSLATAGSISIVLLALAGSLKIMSDMDKFIGKALGSVVILGLIAAGLGVIISTMADMTQHVENAIPCAVSLGIFLNAVATACLILSKANAINASAIATAGVMSALMIIVAPMISTMTNSIKDVSTAVGSAVSLGIFLNAMASACLILSESDKINASVIVTAGVMSALVIILAPMLSEMSNNMKDISSAIGAAVSLGILLNALSTACVILSKAGTVAPSAMVAAGVMTGIVFAMSKILEGLLKCKNTTEALTVAAGLSTLILSLSAACVILEAAGLVAGAAMAGIAALGTLVVGMAGLLVVFGAIMTEIPKAQEFLQNGIPVFEAIGEALGNFVGKLVGGVLEGISSTLPGIGKSLSDFMTNLNPFIENAKKITPEIGTGIKSLAEALLILTAADLLEQITSWLTGGSSLSSFAEELVPFADAFAQFATRLQEAGVKPQFVQMCGYAVKAIAEFANNIPNQGGRLAEWIGDNTLTQFAEGLGDFAGPFIRFCRMLMSAKIDNQTVEMAMNSAKAIAEFANNIPNQGGRLAEWLGDNKLGDFAKELEKFGGPFVNFCKCIMDAKIDTKTVDTATASAKSVAEFANTLKNHDGILQKFTGDSSLADFGLEMWKFAINFRKFVMCLSDVDVNEDVVNKTVNSAKAVVKLSKTLGNSGSIFEVFTGSKTTIDEFGSQLQKFGEGFAGYYEYIKDVNGDVVSTSVAIANSLLALSEKIGSDDVSIDLASYASELIQFGEGFKEFYDNFSDIDGMQLTNVARALSNLITAMAKATKDSAAGEFSKALADLGKTSMKGFLEPLINADRQAVVAIEKMLKDAAEAITKKRPNFKIAGGYLVSGFIEGIKAKSSEVAAAAQNLGQTAKNSLNKELDIHSPSKEGKKSGEQYGEGVSNGIINKVDDVKKSVKVMTGGIKDTMANSAVGIKESASKLSENLFSGVTGISKSDFDAAKTKILKDRDPYNLAAKSSTKSLEKQAKDAGKAVTDNLSSGLDSGSSKVGKSASKVGKKAKDELKKALPTNAELTKIGATISKGLELSMPKSVKKKNAKNLSIGTEVAKEIQKNLKKADSLFGEYAESTEKKSGKVTYTLKNAADAFAKFKNKASENLKGVAQSFETFAYNTEKSIKNVIEGLDSNRKAIKTYEKEVSTLAKSGLLSKNAWNVLNSLSEEEKMTRLHQLYTGGSKAIKEFSKTCDKNAKEVKKAANKEVAAMAVVDKAFKTSAKDRKAAIKEIDKAADEANEKNKKRAEEQKKRYYGIAEVLKKSAESMSATLEQFNYNQDVSFSTIMNGTQSQVDAQMQWQNNMITLALYGASDVVYKYFADNRMALAGELDKLVTAAKETGGTAIIEFCKAFDLQNKLPEQIDKNLTRFIKALRSGNRKELKEFYNEIGYSAETNTERTQKLAENLERIVKDITKIEQSANFKMILIDESELDDVDKAREKVKVLANELAALQFMKNAALSNGASKDSDEVKGYDEKIAAYEKSKREFEAQAKYSNESAQKYVDNLYLTSQYLELGQEELLSKAKSAEAAWAAQKAKLYRELANAQKNGLSDEEIEVLKTNYEAASQAHKEYAEEVEEYAAKIKYSNESLKTAIDNFYAEEESSKTYTYGENAVKAFANAHVSAFGSIENATAAGTEAIKRLGENLYRNSSYYEQDREALRGYQSDLNKATQTEAAWAKRKEKLYKQLKSAENTPGISKGKLKAIAESYKEASDMQKEYANKVIECNKNISKAQDDMALHTQEVYNSVAGTIADSISSFIDPMKHSFDSGIKLFENFSKQTETITKKTSSFFSNIQTDTRTSADSMIISLQKQRNYRKQYEDNMVKIATMGFDSRMIDELKELGISGFNTVRAMADMSYEQINELNEEYRRNLAETSTETAETLSESSEITTRSILDNMRAQIDSVKEWKSNIAKLRSMGLDNGLVDELEAMGTSGAEQVATMAKMSVSEVNEANSYYLETTRAANQQMLADWKKDMDKVPEYIQNLELLKAKGWDEKIVNELRKGGMNNAEIVKQLLTFTPEQQAEYQNKWVQYLSLPEEATGQIMASYEIIGESVVETYSDTMATLPPIVDDSMDDIKDIVAEDSVEAGTEGANAFCTSFTENSVAAFSDVGDTVVKAVSETLNSESGVQIATDFAKGLNKGLNSMNVKMRQNYYSASNILRKTVENQLAPKISEKIGRDFASSLGTGFADQAIFRGPRSNFITAARSLCNALSSTISSYRNSIVGSVTSILSSCVWEINYNRYQWYNGGLYCAAGLAEGIRAQINYVAYWAAQVVYAAINAARAAAQIHSPSKAFQEVGYWMDEGLILGLEKSTDKVVDSATELVDNMMTPFANIASTVSDLLSDDDLSPVITPTLDLSRVEDDAMQLSTMFARQQAMSINARVNAQTEYAANRRQNADSQVQQNVTNNYNMEQNNYSPTALSRYDIYRQTRNQFSQLKEVIAHA